jgi:hypothetical protein
LRREFRNQRLQAVTRFDVAFALRNRGAPGRFDQIEQRFAALILDQLTDQPAEPPDIVAQRLVFLGKNDIRANDRF